jgi:hypothetical protein
MVGDSGVMRVRATRRLFYGATRRSGDIFDLISPRDFAPHCMELVDATTPVRASTPQSVVDAESEATARNRRRSRLASVSEDEGRVLVDWDPLES